MGIILVFYQHSDIDAYIIQAKMDDSQIRPLGNSNLTDQSPLKTTLVFGKPYRRTRYLIFLVCCLCLAPFYYGFTLTYISTISPHMLGEIFGPEAARPTMYGVLIGIVPIGAGVGALIAPLFMNFLSRKNFMLFFNAVAIMISGVIQINYLPVLLACRFFQGFIIGNYMGVAPIYIKQLTPVPLRGSIGAMSQFFNIGGVVICYFLGLVFVLADVNKTFFWRFMFSFTAITVILQSVLLIFNVIPESPASLIEAGHLRQAKKVLAMFNSPNVLDNVFSEYIKQSRRNKFVIRYRRKDEIPVLRKYNSDIHQVQLGLSEKNNTPLVFGIKDDFDVNGKGNILINPSFTKKQSHVSNSDNYTIQIQTIKTSQSKINPDSSKPPQPHFSITIKAFIIGFEIPLMQQMSGVKMIVTEIGIIIAQFDKDLSLYSPLLTNVVQFVATACSIFVLARFGRRPIILLGNLGVALCSLAVGFFFLGIYINGNEDLIYGAMTFIIIFMIAYGSTIGPAVWLYVPEIVPAKVVPPATFMNWLGVSISVIATPIVIEKAGTPYPVFLFFGGISLLFWVMNYFMVIETKGLDPSQIAEKLA